MSFNHSITTSRNHQIELVYPLRFRRGVPTPFPTIYWLRDPELDRALAELERQQAVGRLEQRIADDDELRAAVAKDHERYRDARWAMLSAEHRAVVQASPSLSRAFATGVGGTANPAAVKCLHAHYAHHLATQSATALGPLIQELLTTLL